MVGNAKKSMGNILGKAHINVENYDWFAPGVGTIKSIREEKSNHYLVGTGGMFSIQLESYKK